MGAYAKLSEKSIREAKVEQVKAKILREISTTMRTLKRELGLCLDSEDNRRFAELTKEIFALLSLKEHLEDEWTFIRWVTMRPDMDIIVYYVDDELLDVWSREDYPFVFNFLNQAHEHKYDVAPMLDDQYFGREFTGVIDQLVYTAYGRKDKLAEVEE